MSDRPNSREITQSMVRLGGGTTKLPSFPSNSRLTAGATGYIQNEIQLHLAIYVILCSTLPNIL